MFLAFDEVSELVVTVSDIVVKHIENFALLRRELHGRSEVFQRRFEPLLIRGDLSESQVTMSGLIEVLVGYNETLKQFRRRLDPELLDALVAIQAAAAMEAGLVSPAHLLVDTFPSEQGSQRVTDATTLYKAQKKCFTSSSGSASSARSRPRD